MTNQEFSQRVQKVTDLLARNRLRATLVYYDELHVANGWYLSEWCPQFESGAILVTDKGDTMILGGPESEEFAKMDSAVKVTKNIPVFMVPDEEYPYAKITDFRGVFKEVFPNGGIQRLGIVGMDSMPVGVHKRLLDELKGVELVDITRDYEQLRVIKSNYEHQAIEKSYQITDAGFKEMLKRVSEGTTENEIAGAGEGVVRQLGANGFGFQTIVATGERSNGVVPTSSERHLKGGEIVLLGLSARYRGYNSSAGLSKVVGSPSKKQKEAIKIVAEAYVMCREMLKPGMVGKENYRIIKKFFEDKGGYARHIICPFVHTIGLLEAEAPFFGPNSEDIVTENMAVSIDVSLWNVPDVHGVRVETGFRITDRGYVPFSPYMDKQIQSLVDL